MARSAAFVLLVLVGAAFGATIQNAKSAPAKPTLVSIAKQMFADREGTIERQAVEQDSYLEALEYSQNSAALQGEAGGIGGFFR